jgi:hypothetical protein
MYISVSVSRCSTLWEYEIGKEERKEIFGLRKRREGKSCGCLRRGTSEVRA